MGKSIFTAKQLDFLELAQAQEFIAKKFYLTGGTVLSEFYFQHRLSEDIDLFSEDEDFPKMLVPFNKKSMEKFYLTLAKSLESAIFK